MRIHLAALLLVFPAGSGRAQTQRRPPAELVPVTRGFALGAHTVVSGGLSVVSPDIPGALRAGRGQGVGLRAGYGFGPRLALFVNADVSRQPSRMADTPGSFGLTHLEIGGRYFFPAPGNRLVPFASAVLGSRALGYRQNLEGETLSMRMSGTEYGAGGGILYGLARQISLDAGLTVVRGTLGHATIKGPINDERLVTVDNTTTVRLEIGFSWTPPRSAAAGRRRRG